jgi:predicted Rossmann fold nucleotide-binding protein DprA/Smf involved in DNA uptake
VIAGLAKGIDTAAHTAALEAGGRTVAVIGTGITKCYPAENRQLQDRIATEGLVLSQFWPDSPPTKHTFPMRNAVMSGYGRATIVVEAGERSGARIQARQTVAHGRPVILTDLVVKANKWSAALINRPGVHVASSPAEIMSIVEDIAAGPPRSRNCWRWPPGMTPEELAVRARDRLHAAVGAFFTNTRRGAPGICAVCTDRQPATCARSASISVQDSNLGSRISSCRWRTPRGG